MRATDWIKSPVDMGNASVCFKKRVCLDRRVKRAEISISAIGLFRAEVNGKRVGDDLLTPGMTGYHNRVQYMTYDVSEHIGDAACAEIAITAAPGWAVGCFGFDGGDKTYHDHYAINAKLTLTLADGSERVIYTDESWVAETSPVIYSDIYHGEEVDYTAVPRVLGNAVLDESAHKFPLVPQVGADIREQERVAPVALIVTPKGERVIDFGQNLTGYAEFTLAGKRGERIRISHAEVLDRDGNFYNDNYRAARDCHLTFVLDGTQRVMKPVFSFQGFRYIRLDEYPEGEIDLGAVRAVVVHSEMKRTGRIVTGNPKINQLYHNTIWGQKSNYLDVPTDCPQRDERLGWMGDAQVFCRTAAYNFDVRKFFEKWLGDMRLEQWPDGALAGTVPEKLIKHGPSRVSAAWADAATIIPTELYRMYGDKKVLEDNFEMMRKWVEYQHHAGEEEFLWLGGYHYGDWLAMDAGADSFVGATSTNLIGSAFFAYSTDLLIRAGEALGKDMTEYRAMYRNIVKAFRERFMENGMPRVKIDMPATMEREKLRGEEEQRIGMTQTAIVLILHFGLCTEEERPALVDKLVELIDGFDGLMATGFVGTPYILHVLARGGRADVAYRLLLEERNPSWLYSVNHGATTMWEHWNGIKEDGSFWSKSMNSYNHYAYGSVCDWLYGVAAGISADEEQPGFRHILLAPVPSRELGFMNVSLDTVQGRVESNWYYKGDQIFFEFTVPAGATASLCLPDGYRATLSEGTYHFVTKA